MRVRSTLTTFATLVALAATPLVAPLATPLAAQARPHFTVAAGPAFAIQDAPPSGGAHLRASAALGSLPRPFNLVADAYVSWLPFGSARAPADFGLGPGTYDLNELQWGGGLSGTATLFPSRRVAPYVLVGAVYRWSHLRQHAEGTDPNTGAPVTSDLGASGHMGDILLGLGAHVRADERLWSVEARLYGGSVIYMPITLGVSF